MSELLVANVASGRHPTGAQFSECRTYRYALWRTWEPEDGHLMFVGLNPSTADETEDDPTIRRCIGFAKSWGYGGIHMLNLFAYRSTDPKKLKFALDPIGPENDEFLKMYAEASGRIVAAWGVHGGLRDRDLHFAALERPPYPEAKTRTVGEILGCLGTTKDGFPRHPLYVKGDTQPRRFRVETRG